MSKSNAQFTQVESDILRTILYFDIFSHPLRLEELYRFLPSNSTTSEAIYQLCISAPLNTLLQTRNGFVQLAERPDLTKRRTAGEQNARREFRRARWVAAFIRRIPFVRGVFLSGELSKGVASGHADLDFVIVTSEGRLWIVRTILVIFKRIAFLGSKRFLCLNHFVAEGHLRHHVQNRYTAIEIATLRPLDSPGMLSHYLRENRWVAEYLPNSSDLFSTLDAAPAHSRLQSFLERVAEFFPLSRVDFFLMRMWKKIWIQRYPHLSEEQRDHQFCCKPYLSTAYGSDQMIRILSEYEARLSHYLPFPA